MFENLTQRERILATAVLALVPISLIFVGVFWFMGAYNANAEEEIALLGSIEDQNVRMLEGVKAGKRKSYYASISPPPSPTVASNEYQRWLTQLVEECQLDLGKISPRGNSPLSVKRGQSLGTEIPLVVDMSGELDQLNEFLGRFYAVDLLHRIDDLTITPMTDRAGSKEVRNGKLKIILKISLLTLDQAESRESFTDKTTQRPTDQYVGILRRNVFGPANNTPTLDIKSRSSYQTDQTASFDIEGEDPDKDDLLKFELLESPIPEAELVQAREGDRRARFKIPPQQEGKYEFKVKVIDDGFPPKETIETFTVAYRDPPPPKVEEPKDPPPPPPPFPHWTETRITGIARNRDGDWQAWVNVRTLEGQRYRLKVGESFELDDLTWTVTSITEDEVMFKAGDKRYVARPNPIERGKLVELPDSSTTTSKEVTEDDSSDGSQ